MHKYSITFQIDESFKYMQLYQHIKNMIDHGEIEHGEKLPSVRKLALFLNINTVTVINAYNRLENEGYAVLKAGSGTFAKKREFNKSFKKEYSETFKKLSSGLIKGVVDFAGETTSCSLFPVETFKAVLNEVLDRDGTEAFIYQDILGYEGLRQSIRKYFWQYKIESDDILIISGAQQGIDIISKAIINANDNVLVEKPTYSGALSVFTWRRANIYEVQILKDGVDIISFENMVKKNKIKYFYTMSYFQNPTGATYSSEKKIKILQLASKYDFYIIEDDYLSELIYDSNIKYQSFKSLDIENRVIYLKSFSKIFLPGIRIGYLISPSRFKDVLQNTKINSDISTSSLMQRALDLYIKKGYWVNHITYLNNEYKKRYDLMMHYLLEVMGDKITFNPPGGGLNFFLKLNSDIQITSTELFYKSKSKGVIITPGVIFFKQFDEGEQYFRLGFSQTDDIQIAKGIQVINNLL